MPSSLARPGPAWVASVIALLVSGCELTSEDPCATDAAVAGCVPDASRPPSVGGAHLPTTTVLVYLNADNSLASEAKGDLAELREVGSAGTLDIVVLYDPKGSDPTRILHVKAGGDTVVEDLGETDSSSVSVLTHFLALGMTQFPADRIVVDLWNHGHAWRGYGHDDSVTPASRLGIPETAAALADALAMAGRPSVDLLVFDACLLGSVEVFQYFAAMTGRLVGSENLIPGHGLDYRRLLALRYDLQPDADGRVGTPGNYRTELTPTIEGFAESLLQGYASQAASNKKTSGISLASLSSPGFLAIREALDAFASSAVAGDVSRWSALRAARKHMNTMPFGESWKHTYEVVDLGALAYGAAVIDPTWQEAFDLAKVIGDEVDWVHGWTESKGGGGSGPPNPPGYYSTCVKVKWKPSMFDANKLIPGGCAVAVLSMGLGIYMPAGVELFEAEYATFGTLPAWDELLAWLWAPGFGPATSPLGADPVDAFRRGSEATVGAQLADPAAGVLGASALVIGGAPGGGDAVLAHIGGVHEQGTPVCASWSGSTMHARQGRQGAPVFVRDRGFGAATGWFALEQGRGTVPVSVHFSEREDPARSEVIWYRHDAGGPAELALPTEGTLRPMMVPFGRGVTAADAITERALVPGPVGFDAAEPIELGWRPHEGTVRIELVAEVAPERLESVTWEGIVADLREEPPQEWSEPEEMRRER